MDEENEAHRSSPSDFVTNYYELSGIELEELPLSDKKLTFVKENPGFVVAWLKDFLKNNMNEEKCLL